MQCSDTQFTNTLVLWCVVLIRYIKNWLEVVGCVLCLWLWGHAWSVVGLTTLIGWASSLCICMYSIIGSTKTIVLIKRYWCWHIVGTQVITRSYLSPVDIVIPVQVHSIASDAWPTILPPQPCIGPGVLIISTRCIKLHQFLLSVDYFINFHLVSVRIHKRDKNNLHILQ